MRNRGKPIQAGVSVLRLRKDTVIKMRLPVEVSDALAGTVVVIRNGEHLFKAGFEFF